MTDTADFLAESDYEKHDAFSFAEVGATISGIICEEPRLVELEDLNDKTQKVRKMVVAVDTGKSIYSVWIGRGLMSAAVAKAVKATGNRKLEVGGKLVLKHTEVYPPKQRGWNGAKEYAAKYTPPAPVTEVDDFLDGL